MLPEGLLNKTFYANIFSYASLPIFFLATFSVYVDFFGEAAVGLISLFIFSRAIILFFDFGLSFSITKGAAEFVANNSSITQFDQIFGASLKILLITSIIFSTLGVIFLPSFLSQNLEYQNISADIFNLSVTLIIITSFIYLINGLYRQLFIGLGNNLFVAKVNIFFNFFRFFGVFPLFLFFEPKVDLFFILNFVIQCIELCLYICVSAKKIPHFELYRLLFSTRINSVNRIKEFSLIVAITSSIWIFISNLDKFVAPYLVTLGTYSQFSILVILASSSLIFVSSAGNILMPSLRFNLLRKDDRNFLNILHKFSKLIFGISIIFLIIITLTSLFGFKRILPSIIYEDSLGSVLIFYAIGNFFLSFSSMFYYFQFSIGNLRYHFFLHLILLFVTPISIYTLSKNYGLFGLGLSWFFINAIYCYLAYLSCRRINKSLFKLGISKLNVSLGLFGIILAVIIGFKLELAANFDIPVELLFIIFTIYICYFTFYVYKVLKN